MHRFVASLALLALVPTLAAADTITAEWELDTPGSSFSSFGGSSLVAARGQSFLAGTGGTVVSAALRIGRTIDHAIDLRVSVLPADENGFPTGEPLVTGVFPASSMAAGGAGEATVFTFTSAGEILEAGEQYVLVAEAAEAGGEGSLYFLNGPVPGAAAYADGAAYFRVDSTWSFSTADFAFRVVVDETTPVAIRSWGAVKAGK